MEKSFCNRLRRIFTETFMTHPNAKRNVTIAHTSSYTLHKFGNNVTFVLNMKAISFGEVLIN